MNKQAKQKQISHYLRIRFFILALFCFAVIFLLSFLILKADSEQLFNGMLGTALKWLSNRIFPLAPLLFIFCIITIIYFQRRQLIAYLATLSANFETISLEEDQEKQRFPLPGILKDTEESIERLQLALREKEQARKEIEQRKNDLIVYLAHDLKTPISSIIGYLTLLRDERSISDEMHQKFIQVTLHNAERLDDLINEFFEITRFNLANISLNYSKVNISFMLEQLLFELQPALKRKNVTYQLDGSKDVEIVCDTEKIQRVFDNLLSNAVHYSLENSSIIVSVTQDNGDAVIQFSNQSYPIEQEKLDRIFEQFFRLDTSRSSRNGGAGLGLAIAKQIIEQHHGTITAKSEDQHILFKVIIPLTV
ncbi:hypothetical protein CHH62_20020 [Niallia circulans]|uniref:sensor histidine kinase n=1 Tax=Niallia circulans TaxID=1397 RepID=UPI000BA68FE0|nr:HAMP domain-containing sensor histidine kinase [Niallia circulans]PAD23964.1 hypothetical protein CHH62_20020 [Niallia circulans]